MNEDAYLFKAGLLYRRRAVRFCRNQAAFQQGRKKAYTHITAAGLRMKDSAMKTVTSVQENAGDILASAKDINEKRAAKSGGKSRR